MRRLLSLLLLATCLCAPALAAPVQSPPPNPQRIIILVCDVGQKPDTSDVDNLLYQGWHIDSVSTTSTVCQVMYSNGQRYREAAYFTFVLSRPDPRPAGVPPLSP